ncbi:hypothetical protein [Clostridium butyricum]|nr:hypothetical protein [Clostridium butyricum]
MIEKLKLDLSNETRKKELAKDICAKANSNDQRGYIKSWNSG